MKCQGIFLNSFYTCNNKSTKFVMWYIYYYAYCEEHFNYVSKHLNSQYVTQISEEEYLIQRVLLS